MKKIAFAAMIGLLAVCAGKLEAAQFYTQNLANEPGLAYNNTYVLTVTSTPSNQAGLARVSAQMSYSSFTAPTDSFNGGRVGTGTITVNSNSGLAGAFATDTITVPPTAAILGSPATNQFTISSNSGLGSGATTQITIGSVVAGVSITFNGATSFTALAGGNWNIGTSSIAAANNLQTLINSYSAYTDITSSASNINSVIYCTATINGIGTNSYTVTDSSFPLISTTTFSGGTPNASITMNGIVLTNGNQWNVGANTSATATSIAAALNTYVTGSVDVTANAAGNVVFSTAGSPGAIGNNFTEASSNLTAISTASTNFTGGANDALLNASITFNGVTQYNGGLWTDSSGISSMTAVSISNWLDSFAAIVATTGVNGGSVVYTSATFMGQAGNANTLASSTLQMPVLSANFTGGQDTASVTINGVVLTAGVQGSGSFAIGASAGATAINISSAIVNTAALQSVVVSTTNGGQAIVFTSGTVVGLNYALATSTQAALTISPFTSSGTTTGAVGSAFGESNSSWTINTTTITIAAHGLTKGLPVVFSTGSAVGIVPLAWGTTYYVIPYSANTIALASSTINATSNIALTLTSSATLTSVPSFTLIPPYSATGGASWKWQASNDSGVTWTDLTTPSSYTITAYVFPSTSTLVDFSDVDYQSLRLNVTAPVTGAVTLKAAINGRQ